MSTCFFLVGKDKSKEAKRRRYVYDNLFSSVAFYVNSYTYLLSVLFYLEKRRRRKKEKNVSQSGLSYAELFEVSEN